MDLLITRQVFSTPAQPNHHTPAPVPRRRRKLIKTPGKTLYIAVLALMETEMQTGHGTKTQSGRCARRFCPLIAKERRRCRRAFGVRLTSKQRTTCSAIRPSAQEEGQLSCRTLRPTCNQRSTAEFSKKTCEFRFRAPGPVAEDVPAAGIAGAQKVGEKVGLRRTESCRIMLNPYHPTWGIL